MKNIRDEFMVNMRKDSIRKTLKRRRENTLKRYGNGTEEEITPTNQVVKRPFSDEIFKWFSQANDAIVTAVKN